MGCDISRAPSLVLGFLGADVRRGRVFLDSGIEGSYKAFCVQGIVAASTVPIPVCFCKYTITDSLLRQAKKCTIIVSSCMSIEEMICRCLRCGHEWVKRLRVTARPVRCPACKQHNWDKELGQVKMGRPPTKPVAASAKVRASAKRKKAK
jgi:hypothetical protein